MINAGVIFKVQFNQVGTWDVNYYDYVDDDIKSLKEAKEIENDLDYFDYLDGNFNKHKMKNYNTQFGSELDNSSLSFDNNSNNFNSKDVENKRREYKKACDHNSLLWKGVISFDHEYLIDKGLLHSEEDKLIVKDKLIKQYARDCIASFIEEAGLKEANYHAGIHYNTDNIHIHFAVYENYGRTKKGVLDEKVLEKVKSKMVNNIESNKEVYKRLDILKKQIKNETNKKLSRQQKDLNSIKILLPKEGRVSYSSLEESSQLKAEVDKLVEKELNNNENYAIYQKELDDFSATYSKAYGGDKYKKYKINKFNELNIQMGNMILKEVKNMEFNNSKLYPRSKLAYRTNSTIKASSRLLNKLKHDIDEKKEFDMLQAEL